MSIASCQDLQVSFGIVRCKSVLKIHRDWRLHPTRSRPFPSPHPTQVSTWGTISSSLYGGDRGKLPLDFLKIVYRHNSSERGPGFGSRFGTLFVCDAFCRTRLWRFFSVSPCTPRSSLLTCKWKHFPSTTNQPRNLFQIGHCCKQGNFFPPAQRCIRWLEDGASGGKWLQLSFPRSIKEDSHWSGVVSPWPLVESSSRDRPGDSFTIYF